MEEERRPMPHSFFMEERAKISISGVRDVNSFDEETLIVFTDLGEITVKGERISSRRQRPIQPFFSMKETPPDDSPYTSERAFTGVSPERAR